MSKEHTKQEPWKNERYDRIHDQLKNNLETTEEEFGEQDND